MKYRPGDKVKIKSLDWYNANKICESSKFMQAQGIRRYVECNGFRFLDVMCEYCGKNTATVEVAINEEESIHLCWFCAERKEEIVQEVEHG